MKNYFSTKTAIALIIFGLAGCTGSKVADNDTPTISITKFKAYTQKFPESALITQNHATGHIGDFFFTYWIDVEVFNPPKDGTASGKVWDAAKK